MALHEAALALMGLSDREPRGREALAAHLRRGLQDAVEGLTDAAERARRAGQGEAAAVLAGRAAAIEAARRALPGGGGAQGGGGPGGPPRS